MGPLPDDWRSKFEEIRKENTYTDADGKTLPGPFVIAHIGTFELFYTFLFVSVDTNSRGKKEADTSWEKFVDTFENRRQSLVSTYTDSNEETSWKYDQDEYTDYDFECLKSILGPMQELLRHEPERRISARAAADLIEWTDHRRVKSEDPDEHDDEPDRASREKDE